MIETWATSGVDLHLDLLIDRTGHRVRASLEAALRDAVRTGRLGPGSRLPSSRSLAADLGIARNTVAGAYGQLVAEGWLDARRGSATRVTDRPARPDEEPAAGPALPAAAGRSGHPRYDLRPGFPDLSAFPRPGWLAAARRALAAAPSEALGYPDPRGRPELRIALAGYLARARGVRVPAGRIVVCSGFTHGLGLLSQVLRARGGRALAVEEYGHPAHRSVVTAAGLSLAVLPVDSRGAAVADAGPACGLLLTPAHQFPLGAALAPQRRSQAIEWARSRGGVVIEDDYDGEFRYDRQPVGAMQALAPGPGGLRGLGQQEPGPRPAPGLAGRARRAAGRGGRGQLPGRPVAQQPGPAHAGRVHHLGRLRPADPPGPAGLPAPPRPAGHRAAAKRSAGPHHRHRGRPARAARTARGPARGRGGGPGRRARPGPGRAGRLPRPGPGGPPRAGRRLRHPAGARLHRRARPALRRS